MELLKGEDNMPKTKDGGFLLDDSSCAPYGDGVIRGKKQIKYQNDSKKKKSGKKK